MAALIGPALVFAIFASGSAAEAQSIDYGAAEQLFGEPITTSVTGSPQRASDVPATMVIVTAEEIRRSGAQDIPGVLRHVAGVDVLQWHDDDADVSVRGYNQAYSPRLLVLIDGRQVYADYFGYTPWTALPVELADIRQIEVVEGPNSALFGFNAAGGVIDIITYNPLYDRINTSSLDVGTQSSFAGSVVDTVKLGNIGGARFSAGGRSNDDFSTLVPSVEIGTRNADDRGDFNLRSVLRLGRNVTTDFDASTSRSDEAELSPGYNTYFSNYATKSVKLALSADTHLGLIQADTYTNWISLDGYNQLDNALSSIAVNNQVSVTQIQDELKIGTSQTLRASVEYRHNAMPTLSGGADVAYSVLSEGGMWDWKITPALSLTNAIRLDQLTLGRSGPVPEGYGLTNADWNGRKLHEPSFNSGFVWRPDAGDTYRLIAARGVQMPSLLELGGLLDETSYGAVSGIPTLMPSITENYEIDWDHLLSSSGTTLRLSAYHESTNDIVGLLAGNDYPKGLVATPATIGSSEATGLELSLTGTFPSGWRWGASYTPEIIRDDFGPGYTVATTAVDFAQTTPVHVANANLGWARGRWEADGYLRYESAFYSIGEGSDNQDINGEALSRVPSYVSVDARLGYRLSDRLTLDISGQNVLHAQQVQTSGPALERRLIGTLNVKL